MITRQSGGNHKAIVLEQSPVSFVITGPGKFHREILIRSGDKNLDLVGLDSWIMREYDDTNSVKKISLKELPLVLKFSPRYFNWQRILGDFGFSPDILDTFVVRSKEYNSSQNDPRNTYLSLSWRGLARQSDLDRIQRAFVEVAPDISTLIQRNENSTFQALEWQVAPIVALCNSTTNQIIRQRKTRWWLLMLVLSVYALTGVVAFGSQIFNFLDRLIKHS